MHRERTKKKQMLRKSLTVVVAVLGFSLGLVAQSELFLGVWELNLAKSTITRGTPPKSHTLVNLPEPGGFKSVRALVMENTTSAEIHHYRFDGLFYQTEGGDPRELAFKRIDQTTLEETAKRNRNGEITTATRRMEVSKDGKTLTIIAPGANGAGTDIRIYDKR